MEAQQGMDVARLVDHGLFTVTLSAIDHMPPVTTNTTSPFISASVCPFNYCGYFQNVDTMYMPQKEIRYL